MAKVDVEAFIGGRYYIHSGDNRGSIFEVKSATSKANLSFTVWNETHNFEHTMTVDDLNKKCNRMPSSIYRVIGTSQGGLR